MAEQRNPSPNHDELSPQFLDFIAELKPRQRAFLQHYCNPQSPGFGNATKSAELTGYAGEPGSVQLSVQGHRLLKSPKIQQCLGTLFEAVGCTLELDAKVIFEAMTATRTRYLRGADNTIISTPPEPDHQTRLRAVELRHRLLRTPPTATHQRLEPGVSAEMAQPGEPVCAFCGEAMSKVAALNPADRALLRNITKLDQELRSAETPQQNAGEEHGELDAPGKNSC